MGSPGYADPTVFFDGSNPPPRLARTLWLSLILHLLALVAAIGLRLPSHMERPLASVEVSLVNLAEPTKTAEPLKPKPSEPAKPEKAAPAKPQKAVPAEPLAPPKPVEAPKAPKAMDIPKPAPPVSPPVTAKAEAVPAPLSRSDAQGAKRSSGDVMRDVLRGIELPPDAPQLGELSPTRPVADPQRQNVPRTERSPEKFRKDLDTVLNKLKVPDVPSAQDVAREATVPSPPPKSRSSLSEELKRELDEELKKIQKAAPPPNMEVAQREPAPPVAEPATKPTPQVEARAASSVKQLDTTLKIPGIAPGSNAYLARVQQRISSFWTAPPVDVSGTSLAVVIRFRLHKDGSVSSVSVEQSSGNEYYDLAGKRAVLSAKPLPAFPPELKESYFDAHFSFAVGDQNG